MRICLLLMLLSLSATVAAQTLQFQPYDPGAPAATVGGSIRGAETDLAITLLAPPQLAVSASALPALYWHASSSIEVPVELVVVAEGGAEPLLEQRLEPPIAAGIHRFALPASAKLEIGSYYQWSVAAMPDENNRSSDVFASAVMQRVADPALEPDLNVLERAGQLAARGIWYDTLDLLAQSADAMTQAASLRRQLLEQAGLQSIADAQWRK